MKTTYQITPLFVLHGLITISAGLSVMLLQPQSALSAEKVQLIYGPFRGKISIKSLEKYAETGEMTREFRLYSKFLDKETLIQLRYWLNNRFESDRVEVYRFTNTSEGEKFLTDLGTAIKTHPERNGLYAIRSALIEAADKPSSSDGWTIIEAMYHFPTEDLQINTRDLFKLQKFWSASDTKNQAALDTFNSKSKE
ncbi:alpha/beta hydrolase [Waterburya agarophytonicola K14]|uniref:Alpha/beta hydrolase n=1 Tax=Waterburya agarophytonicola KI4 TaxID=2874699 RepID=A0A964FID6_9CYAN|nr:alpha/beta hydrolase [Waterburya agarophytonicola]MCC0179787.1 alpha/beta hydrolase [Waterburya agarophytonicola KI4]